MVREISLPNNWNLRSYQKNLWSYLRSGGKRAVCVWHRRAGKDEVCLHNAAVEAHRRVGNYWHMLPEYSQARKAIWDAVNPHTGKRRIDEAFPHELRRYTRENEMSIGFHNGSTWQVVGSDNYDSLMGTAPAGITMSEYALANPNSWGYFSPILMENNGWALFISTPRGKNHFHSLVRTAQKEPSWFCEVLTNENTGVFSEKDLDSELSRLQDQYGDQYGKSLWLQEYFCSFDAAIPGSIWGDCIDRAKKEGRITRVEHDPSLPVLTAWDLGFTDDTAIWFYQISSGQIRIIDYHFSVGKDVPYYAELLREKTRLGWTFSTHWLPHDARARTLAAGGKSIQQQMIAQNVGRIVIAPRLDHEDGIQAARATFPFCWFDSVSCEDGIEALKNYRREWDEEKKAFSPRPLHDWASHGSSAFRTLSLSWKRPKNRNEKEVPLEEKLKKGSVENLTFGEITKRHFDKRKSLRESYI